jgi:hypothetical protein
MRVFGILVVALTLALPACSGKSVNHTWDNLYDFQGLNTYDWAPKEPESGPELPYDLIDAAVKRTAERVLARRGFRRSSENPSFRIIYYVGGEEVAALRDSRYYGPGWGGHWGYGWYGPAGVNASLYDERTLTIDILSADASSGLIWRGVKQAWDETALTPERIVSGVEAATAEILSRFPPDPDD